MKRKLAIVLVSASAFLASASFAKSSIADEPQSESTLFRICWPWQPLCTGDKGG